MAAAQSAQALQSLKAALVRDGGAGEQVQVNQRALIDKLLARYSSEFTVFRELLQNSNDAGATAAQIVFRRDSSLARPSFLPWTKSADVASVAYRNNGRPMSTQDFARLRSIAEGNPDVQKIGFFGVGFYSLFSICEEPFVTSGNESMAFLWKGDALYTKRGTLPPESVSEWTTFFLDLREPIEVPKTAEFGRFLATSLAFTTSLCSVEVFVDDERILFFEKKGSSKSNQQLEMPDRRSYTLASPNNVFRLSSISVSKIQMDVEVKGRRDLEKYTIFMRIGTGDLAVSVPRKVSEDMLRTTKKGTPATTPLRIMFSNYDEYESSANARVNGSNMFDDLIPGSTDQGRIFIGFPTHQTTGCAIQLAAHLIPTVERENIDFVDRTLQYWNQELLAIGGVITRAFYEDELNAIQRLYSEMGDDTTSRQWLEKRAVHVMNAFTFKPSTPSSVVGRILSEGFYSMCKLPVRVISTRGMLPAVDVRLPADDMSAFVRTTPILSREAIDNAPEFVKRLRSAGLLQPVGIADILIELDGRAFSVDETVALMKWWMRAMTQYDLASTRAHMAQIQRRLVVQDASLNNVRLPVSRMTHFIMPQTLSPDLPMPESVMPYAISKHFSKTDLETAFWMLQEISITDWVKFIVKHAEFSQSPEFTERVLAAVCRSFSNASTHTREAVLTTLTPTRCIVTQRGFMYPSESYLTTVTLFADLPKVTFANPRAITDSFLKSLGVREHVDLQMVFDRLNTLNWDQVQLIKYLASVQTKLTLSEVGRLRVSALFLRETATTASSETKPDEKTDSKRYRASDLYEPNDTLRKFNLPLLAYTTKWRSTSDEGKLMTHLGLRRHVPVIEFVSYASTAATPEMRMEWIRYFIANYDEAYVSTYAADGIVTPFLPTMDTTATSSGGGRLALPTECFVDTGASVMGFAVLDPSLKPHADKLGVARSPSPSALLDRLRTSPPTIDKAADVFVFLGTCQSMLTKTDWMQLKSLRFIPVRQTMKAATTSGDTGDGTGAGDFVVVYMAPTMVYIDPGDPSALIAQFTYVDYGASANAFLRACGVKDQPSPLELATNVVKSPHEFIDTAGLNGYMGLLRQIAANFESLKRHGGLIGMMKTSAFLIGSCAVVDGDDDGDKGSGEKETSGKTMSAASTLASFFGGSTKTPSSSAITVATEVSTDNTTGGNDNSGKTIIKYKLAKASDIYLIDDTVLSQLFRPLGAPIDEILEPMYQHLGSKWLSENVTESYSFQGTVTTTTSSTQLQAVINERAPLLLYDGHKMRPSRDLKTGGGVLTSTSPESVLASLRVYHVATIDIVRQFNTVSRTQRTTACMAHDTKTRSPTLLVTDDHDSFDVATVVARIVLRQPRLNDFLLMSTLLSTSLENLMRKGFPVDRILNLRASKAKIAAANAVVERESSVTSVSSKQKSGGGEPQPSSSSNTPKPHQRETQTLLSVFPDADPSYVQSLVDTIGSTRLQEIANKMSVEGYKKLSLSSSSSTMSSSTTQVDEKSQSRETDPLLQKPGAGGTDEQALTPHKKKDDDDDDDRDYDDGFLSMIDKLTGFGIKNGLPPGLSDMASRWTRSLTGGITNSHATTMSNATGHRNTSTTPDITPNQTTTLRTHLKEAIASTRVSHGTDIRSTIPLSDTPTPTPTPTPPAVSTSMYNECRPTSDQDLVLVTRINTIPVYIDRAVTDQAHALLTSTPQAAPRFIRILEFIANVFELPRGSVHVYWDRDGSTVAFNRNRSLFMNLRFFVGLHYTDGTGYSNRSGDFAQRVPGSFPTPVSSTTTTDTTLPPFSSETATSIYYWFLTTCHELAHHFVAAHDATHEHWMSSFAEMYMGKLVGAMTRERIDLQS